MWDAFCAFHICIARLGDGLDLGQPVHLHIAFGAPLSCCDVPQPGSYEHQGRVPVWEGADYTRLSADRGSRPKALAGARNAERNKAASVKDTNRLPVPPHITRAIADR